MAEPSATIHDIDELLDGQRVGWPMVSFILLNLLALTSDGFDIGVIGFVAPELVKSWHVPPAELAPVLAAGLWGLLVGGPAFGLVGDRWGRKRAVTAGLALAGAMTLLCAASGSLIELAILRFLSGIGLGGAVVNILALVAETAPRRWRARFMLMVGFGVPIGLALPGVLSAMLVPLLGWPVLFVAGGVFAAATALATVLLVPESLRFLARVGGNTSDARRIARWFRPDLSIADDGLFTLAVRPASAPRRTARKLFAGSLRVVTPAIWLAGASNQMANFFVISWLPTLLQSTGSGTARAGLSASLFATGGLVGTAVMAGVLDRFGTLPSLVSFAVSVPLVAAMGLPDLPGWLYVIVVAVAGACVTGNNGGINATLGAVYPTPVRAAGIGWAQGFGRLGSIVAPAVGGLMLASGAPVRDILLAPALALLIGGLAWSVVAVTCVRRFRGSRLREIAIDDPA